MNYLQLAYLQGMNKAAQEFGFASYENFKKEAEILGPITGAIAGGLGGTIQGALLGGTIGGLGGIAFGDKDKELWERMQPGLTRGVQIGGLGGAALGTLGGAIGGTAYKRLLDKFDNMPVPEYPWH